MTEVDIEARLLRLAGNPFPMDSQVSRGELYRDHSYADRLVLGSFPIFALETAKRAADEFAASYRGFDVGVTAVGFNSETNEIGYFSGVNIKVDDTDLVNIHAEDVLLEKLARHGYDYVPLVAVVGPLQPDTQSGAEQQTLHPCGKCRGSFHASPLVTDHTLFFSATRDFSTVELTSLAEMMQFHEAGDASGVDTFMLGEDFAGWDELVIPAMLARYRRNYGL